jgi:hypothetical protein
MRKQVDLELSTVTHELRYQESLYSRIIAHFSTCAKHSILQTCHAQAIFAILPTIYY